MKRKRNPDQVPFDFMLPNTDWQPPDSLPDLRGTGVIAIDCETKDDGLAANRGPGWVFNAGYICGVSVASAKGAVYIPVRHPDTRNFAVDSVIRWLRDHIESNEDIIFQNAHYDLGWFSLWDIAPPEKLHDTIAMAYMIDEQRLTYNLDSLCSWQGIQGKDEALLRQAAEALGCDPKADMWRMPARFVGPYAEQDAIATLELYNKLIPQIHSQNVWEAYRLECDLIPMVLEMRKRGIRIDIPRAERVRDELLAKRDEALSEISRNMAIGRSVTMKDILSPSFLTKAFDAEGIPYPRTEKGNPSFSADWLKDVDHWLPQNIVQATKMHDAGDKFIKDYILDFTHCGRLHAEIHQYKSETGGTKTSRFSYSNPPLQQMPSRHPEIATMIRGLFLPEEGEVWGALDYSQQEYRLIVHFAYLAKAVGAEDAVRTYLEDPRTDFHSMAAAMTNLPRRRAKDVNFAKAYGAGVNKFASMTGMTLEEAKQVMEQYDTKLPFVKRLNEMVANIASQRGYIVMLDGARARFNRWEPKWIDWDAAKQSGQPLDPCSYEQAVKRVNDPNHPWTGALRRAFTHKAMNWLIQGSAARQTKLCMRECWREGIVPMLQMHDELDFSFSNKKDAERAEEIMRDTVKLAVPVVVDAEFGDTWGTAKATDSYGATWEEAWELVHVATQ